MMRLVCTWLLAGVVVAGLSGCASSAITGEGTRVEQVFTGDVGISGEDHRVTILRGSDIRKLSIMGEDIEVVVDDGAVVRKIEIVGDDNEVICPKGMIIEYTEIGEGNRVKRR